MEIGGGAQVTRLWRGVFAQASFTRWDESGERVFIDSRGTKFNLGIPLNIKTTNIDISGGWRFENTRRARRQRVMPYVGGGVGIVKFQESSPFAQSGDDVNEQYTSYHVLGGVEVRLIKWLAVGADVRHRIVPELLGQGGVSSALDETSFNNTSVAGRVLVGF